MSNPDIEANIQNIWSRVRSHLRRFPKDGSGFIIIEIFPLNEEAYLLSNVRDQMEKRLPNGWSIIEAYTNVGDLVTWNLVFSQKDSTISRYVTDNEIPFEI